jgi:squalene-hopene/tetraprenyl-beta-curcumene cyclase
MLEQPLQPPTTLEAETLELARRTLEPARENLLALQNGDGHWRALLQTNVTMDAEDLLLREFLGLRDEDRSRRAGVAIRSHQREDGSWANFYGGPGDLSTTVEAYWVLKLIGEDPQAEHMSRAARWIRAHGGQRSARVFTHIWMALFGLWPWDDIPALPPELILLPSWFPLNPYDFAAWARQTVVALTIVRSHRPVRPMALSLDELGPGAPAYVKPPSSRTGRLLVLGDQLLRRYEHSPIKPLRRLALREAERWVVQRQEADGGWGGIQPPWVYSLIALTLQGYPPDHPVIQKALTGLEGFTVQEEDSCWLEACQSPVWDTALATLALAQSGSDPDDPALVRAGDWLLERQVTEVAGDWAVRRPNLRPGGWFFEYHNVNYPDNDDAGVVALALRAVDHPRPERVRRAVARAAEWLVGMQSGDGGWGAFDADNFRELCRKIPFSDFGEVIDPPSADVTAHAVELLYRGDFREHRASAEAGLRWLLEAQEEDGSWFGRWGVNHIYGTWSVLMALEAAGLGGDHPAVRRAARWLEAHQNPDGGWGEDCRSYEDPAWIGRGESTASQTAWALLGLHAAGRSRSAAVRRGVQWLAERQRPDGGWDEPQYTGTGFPGYFYIKYHLYSLVFPVTALGHTVRALTAHGSAGEAQG